VTAYVADGRKRANGNAPASHRLACQTCLMATLRAITAIRAYYLQQRLRRAARKEQPRLPYARRIKPDLVVAGVTTLLARHRQHFWYATHVHQPDHWRQTACALATGRAAPTHCRYLPRVPRAILAPKYWTPPDSPRRATHPAPHAHLTVRAAIATAQPAPPILGRTYCIYCCLDGQFLGTGHARLALSLCKQRAQPGMRAGCM